MDDEGTFKFLAIVIVAILVISLLINAFLASDPHSFSAPPIRIQGYLTSSGTPAPGYYIAPGNIETGSPGLGHIPPSK